MNRNEMIFQQLWWPEHVLKFPLVRVMIESITLVLDQVSCQIR